MVRFTSLTLLAAAALLAFLPGLQAGSIKSGLQIEPGQTFELGGGQRGGFTVTGTNTGPVAVEVLGKPEDAPAITRATVAPGAKLEADFGPGEMALLRNTSTARTATLKLKITGDTAALGMGYSAQP